MKSVQKQHSTKANRTIDTPTVFKWRYFQGELIVLCLCWYLRYSLSYRDLEEMMVERGLKVDHSTIARWVLAYAPEMEKRVKPQLKPTNDSWKVDEKYIKVKSEWLFASLKRCPTACAVFFQARN
jgi:transposase-like protein